MTANSPVPVARSVTRRRKHITKAKSILARYAHLTTLRPTDTNPPGALTLARITELLRAQAEIEKALYLETGGRVGDIDSTPRRIMARITVTTGEEAADVIGR